MNELPVIGSLCLRKDFWDRHGANIATHKKGMYSETFRSPKKREIIAFLPLIYQKWGVSNIDTRVAQGFI